MKAPGNDIQQRDIRNFQARYHRNGVGGNGFHLCEFKLKDGRNLRDLRAVVFSEPGNIAIVSGEIGERFRGDGFEAAIREAIALAEKNQGDEVHGF